MMAKGVLEASCTTSAPEWVPMGAAGNKFLAVARGEVDAALVGRGFGAPETEPPCDETDELLGQTD